MIVIGITGGSGAGKSTVTEIWQKRGAVILDADAVYRELLETEDAMRAEMCARFGDIFPDGRLDRRTLADTVFSDEKALADLNGITHIYIVEEIRRRVKALREQGKVFCAIDAIYLLESELRYLCDETVAVTCPIDKRVERVMKRDGLDEKQAWRRIKSQKSDEYYFEQCDIALENMGDWDALAAEAGVLYDTIISKNKGDGRHGEEG